MGHAAGRYGDVDYPTLAKYGFLAGLAMFVAGAGGELVVHSVLAVEDAGVLDTVLLDLEIVGLLVGFLSPIVFGIVMPLTE